MSLLTSSTHQEESSQPSLPRSSWVKRVAFLLIPLIGLIALGESVYFLSPDKEPDPFSGVVTPPPRWLFPESPNGSTQNPILVKFRQGWAEPQIRLADMPAYTWKARMTALCELARLGEELQPLLLKGLEDQDPEIRLLAAQAMGYFSDPSQADRLQKVMREDPEGTVRVQAALSRVMIGGPISEDLVREVTRLDPVKMVGSRLELAITREAEPRGDTIRKALASYDLTTMDTARLGQLAPDFELTDQAGQTHRLSDYRGKKSVVLVFVYGVTCMYCSGQVGLLHTHIQKFENEDAQVLVVESQEHYRRRAILKEAHISTDDTSVPVLSDPSHTVAATYGVAMQMNHVEWLNRPSSFVIDRDGIIRYVKLGKSERDRPSAFDLIAQVQKLRAEPEDPASPAGE